MLPYSSLLNRTNGQRWRICAITGLVPMAVFVALFVTLNSGVLAICAALGLCLLCLIALSKKSDEVEVHLRTLIWQAFGMFSTWAMAPLGDPFAVFIVAALWVPVVALQMRNELNKALAAMRRKAYIDDLFEELLRAAAREQARQRAAGGGGSSAARATHSEADALKVLGFTAKPADVGEVKRAYRGLAKQYHPDRPTGDEAKFKEVNNAFDTLKKLYDIK